MLPQHFKVVIRNKDTNKCVQIFDCIADDCNHALHRAQAIYGDFFPPSGYHYIASTND